MNSSTNTARQITAIPDKAFRTLISFGGVILLIVILYKDNQNDINLMKATQKVFETNHNELQADLKDLLDSLSMINEEQIRQGSDIKKNSDEIAILRQAQ